MSYDIALKEAAEALAGRRPYVVASLAGVPFDEGRFKLSYFNRAFYVYHPEIRVEDAAASIPVPQWIQLVLLHYLVTADGTGVADSWIAYRQLPGAALFERRFVNMALNTLRRAFDNDVETFRHAATALGGTPMSRMGDAAFRFLALPQIPMACVFYLGDEEVAPSFAILFDAAAPHYLPTEDLSYVGTYLSTALQRHGS